MQTLRSLAILPALAIALVISTFGATTATKEKLGTIKVTVIDSTSGSPLARASVSLLQIKKGAYTNESGGATLLNVPYGKYTIKVAYVGYDVRRIENVIVGDHTIALTVKMHAVMRSDTIVVNGKKLMVDKSCTDQGRKFSQADVLQTPGRQRLDEITKMTPGVMTDNGNARPSINGGRGYQNSVKINGVEMQDVVDGRSSAMQNSISTFGISELDIRASGGPADPHSLGGGINVIQNEEYKAPPELPYKLVTTEPLSTFSIDVDRASYANVRRFLTGNMLPPADAVRVEEMINYFHYDLPQPKGSDPIAIFTDMAACPWNEKHRIVQVSLKGREIAKDNLPPANLVFLIDVSGSMNSPEKLPLLKSAFRLLVEQLRTEDKVSIVTYAGNAGLVLPATSGSEKAKILQAIDQLTPGGSTAGAAGIQLAYQIAKDNKTRENNSRVILATDGDFNVGISNDDELVKFIEAKRDQGIFLTVMGFGTGNYKDAKMEQLADKGNGNYAYCDNLLEAQKTFVTELGGTLATIAKDVKIQIEFNPKYVQAYRLIGYENRMLNKEDFNNDKKDAGELGAGHEVTALYEIVPAGVKDDPALSTVDPLKYQQVVTPVMQLVDNNEMMTVKFRYKDPTDSVSKLVTTSVMANESLRASENLQWSMAVAQFGMLLRGSEYRGSANIASVQNLANASKGNDAEGYRAEFIRMLRIYELLSKNTGSAE